MGLWRTANRYSYAVINSLSWQWRNPTVLLRIRRRRLMKSPSKFISSCFRTSFCGFVRQKRIQNETPRMSKAFLSDMLFYQKMNCQIPELLTHRPHWKWSKAKKYHSVVFQLKPNTWMKWVILRSVIILLSKPTKLAAVCSWSSCQLGRQVRPKISTFFFLFLG